MNATAQLSFDDLPAEIQFFIVCFLLDDTDEAGDGAAITLRDCSPYWNDMVDSVARKVRENVKVKRTLKRLMKDEKNKSCHSDTNSSRITFCT